MVPSNLPKASQLVSQIAQRCPILFLRWISRTPYDSRHPGQEQNFKDFHGAASSRNPTAVIASLREAISASWLGIASGRTPSQ